MLNGIGWYGFIGVITTSTPDISLTTGLTKEDFEVFATVISHAPLQPCTILMDQISFSSFCKGPPNNHFCQINFNFNSDHWFQKSKIFKVCRSST